MADPIDDGGADGLGPEQVATRSIEVSDLDAVAAVHRRAFPDSVLSSLGHEAVRRYYRWQLSGPHEIAAIGAFAEGALLGFLFGGRFRGSMIGFVKREPVFLAVRVARHPGVVLGGRGRAALRAGIGLLVTPRSKAMAERPERVPDRSFGILVVAVDPQAQREGLGGLLLEEAQRQATAMGSVRMHLTIDPSNWGAAAFYREQGWVRLGLDGDTDRSWLIGKELGDG